MSNYADNYFDTERDSALCDAAEWQEAEARAARRFRVTYWEGRAMHTYLRDASNSEAACVGVPADAEHLNVREV